eukprot:2156033-Pleurochrysis_carterae.AAC.1
MRAVGRHFRAVNGGPITVVGVVGDFRPFCSAPTDTIFGHCLFAGARVSGDVVDGKGTARAASPRGRVAARLHCEQR